jgi:hypothetical protein
MESSCLARLDGETIKATENNLGVIWVTEADVQLHHFVSSHGAVVGDGSLNGVEDVPKLRVTSRRTTSGNAGLWTTIGRTSGPSVVEAVLGILRCRL